MPLQEYYHVIEGELCRWNKFNCIVNLGPRVFSDKAADEFISSSPNFGEKNACAVRLNVCF